MAFEKSPSAVLIAIVVWLSWFVERVGCGLSLRSLPNKHQIGTQMSSCRILNLLSYVNTENILKMKLNLWLFSI